MKIEYIIIGAIVLLVLLFVLLIIAFAVRSKQKKKEEALKNTKENENEDGKETKKEEIKQVDKISKSDVKDIKAEYIDSFLEFDEISDNMIVQNKGDKYIMVIKCQGINYDLMSEAEMISVEEGFIQFLNTLRFPIQLYVQTNTLDLTNSLNEYNQRVGGYAAELETLKTKLRNLEEYDEDNYTEINELKYQIKKQQNVYEYGLDVIKSVEKISKSKSILQQTYYVVVPYFASELGTNSFKPAEIKEMAFSELYTRCRGMISSLAVCSVSGKILDSFELAELLYVAYNRDEGQIYTFRNAIETQYDSLYHTAPDILDKKMEKINQEIYEAAAQKSNEEIIKASGNIPGDVYQNNEIIKQLVYENTKKLIKDYGGMIDDNILQKATQNVKEEYKKSTQNVVDEEENDEEIQIKKTVKKKQKNK